MFFETVRGSLITKPLTVFYKVLHTYTAYLLILYAVYFLMLYNNA